MGGILWPYQTQGLFIIFAPDTDVTDVSHGDCSLTADHTTPPKFYLSLSPITYSYDLFHSFNHSVYSFFPIYCPFFKFPLKLEI